MSAQDNDWEEVKPGSEWEEVTPDMSATPASAPAPAGGTPRISETGPKIEDYAEPLGITALKVGAPVAAGLAFGAGAPAMLGELGPIAHAAASGLGYVTGSTGMQAAIDPAAFDQDGFWRGKIVEALGPVGATIHGKAILNAARKLTGAALNNFYGLIIQSMAAGGGLAEVGKLANRITGTPDSGLQTAADVVLGAGGEALSETARQAMKPLNPEVAAAAQRLGIDTTKLPNVIGDAPGSARYNLIKAVSGHTGGDVQKAVEQGMTGLQTGANQSFPRMEAPETVALSQRMNTLANVEATALANEQAQNVGSQLDTMLPAGIPRGNIAPGNLVPEATRVAEGASMKPVQEIADALGLKVDMAGPEFQAPAVRATENMRKQAGAGISAVEGQIRDATLGVPLDMNEFKAKVGDLYSKIAAGTLPEQRATSPLLQTVKSLTDALLDPAKPPDSDWLVSQLKALREMLRRNPEAKKLAAGELKSLIKSGEKSLASAVDKAVPADEARKILDGYSKAQRLYRNAFNIAEATEEATGGTRGVDPQKFRDALMKRQTEFTPEFQTPAASIGANAATNADMGLLNTVTKEGMAGLFDAMKQGVPGAGKILAANPGAEEQLVRMALDEATKTVAPGVETATMNMVVPKKWAEWQTQHPEFMRSLSPGMQAKLAALDLREPVKLAGVQTIQKATKTGALPAEIAALATQEPRVSPEALGGATLGAKEEMGRTLVQEALRTPEGRPNPTAVERLTRNMGTPYSTAGESPSQPMLEAITTPQQRERLGDLRLYAKKLDEMVSLLPPEAQTYYHNVFREMSGERSAVKAGLGEFIAPGVAKTVIANTAWPILRILPELVSHLTLNRKSPQTSAAVQSILKLLTQTNAPQGAIVRGSQLQGGR